MKNTNFTGAISWSWSDIFGTDETDTWQSDSGCIKTDPDGVVYNEACIGEEISGMDYYLFQDITWY